MAKKRSSGLRIPLSFEEAIYGLLNTLPPEKGAPVSKGATKKAVKRKATGQKKTKRR